MGLGAQGRTCKGIEGVLEQHRDPQQPNEVPSCPKPDGQSQAWAEALEESKVLQLTSQEGTGRGGSGGGVYWSGLFCLNRQSGHSQRCYLSVKAADALSYCK